MSSSDWMTFCDVHLTFTWCSPDVHLTFTWPSDHHLTFLSPLPDSYLALIMRVYTSPEISLNFTWCQHSVHMLFTWHLPDHLTIIWPTPDPYLTLISSLQLKKNLAVGGWVGQPITDPSSGPSFDFDFDSWPWAWQKRRHKEKINKLCQKTFYFISTIIFRSYP